MDPPARAPSLPQNISCVPQDTKRWERRDVRSADQLHGQYGRAEYERGVGQPRHKKKESSCGCSHLARGSGDAFPGGLDPHSYRERNVAGFGSSESSGWSSRPLSAAVSERAIHHSGHPAGHPARARSAGRRACCRPAAVSHQAGHAQWAPQWAPLPFAAPLAFGPMGTLF